MTRDNLRPCPFCGCGDFLTVRRRTAKSLKRSAKPRVLWRVHCEVCGAAGPPWLDDRENAMKAWNTRLRPGEAAARGREVVVRRC